METKNTYLSEKEKAIAMFRWTNKRYKGIFIAYIAMLIITLPLIEFILLIQSKSEKPVDEYVDMVTEAAPAISGSIFAFMVILFTTILSIVAFSYIHNKRCMDLFGSFPMSRRVLFFTRYASVLVQALVPLLVVGLIGAMLTLKLSTFATVMENVALLGLGVIGTVSFIALLSLCCGTVVDVIISFFVINGIYPICIIICTLFPASILPGYNLNSSNINWTIYTLLSPLLAPFTGIWGYNTTMYVVWWILFSAVLIVGCYIFSKKRKTETAQNEFVFVLVEQAIKLFAGFVVGFGMGWILALIGSGSNSSYKAQYIWFFVGLCIGAFMTGVLLHLIYHRGLANIRKSLIISTIDVVMGLGFVMMIVTGVFGYDERVPGIDDIEEVGVYLDNSDSYIVNGKDINEHYTDDKKFIKMVTDVHKTILKDKLKMKKGIYPIIPEREWSDGEAYITSSIKVTYQLKNGEIVKRNYDGYFKGEKIEQLKNYTEKIVNKKKMLEILPMEELYDVTLQTEEYDFLLMNSDFIGTSAKTKAAITHLVEAILKDYNVLGKEKLKEEYALYHIGFGYCNAREQELYFNCVVTKECKYTLECIKEEYPNQDLMWLEQNINADYLESYAFTGKKEKTVYFKVPEQWDGKAEIRALLYSPDMGVWMSQDLEAEMTKCQHVKDDIWKYTYSMPEDMEKKRFESYDRIMFYQILDDKVNWTGAIEMPETAEKKYLVLTKKKEGSIYKYEKAIYKYTWEKFK